MLLLADFCNKIGTKLPIANQLLRLVRSWRKLTWLAGEVECAPDGGQFQAAVFRGRVSGPDSRFERLTT
jgi:hypothetical protein